ncbi:MAG: hypothetical protein ACYCSO_00940 [Cuniculiplasma sp.]
MRRKTKIILAIFTVTVLLSVVIPSVYEKDQSIMPLIPNHQYISIISTRDHNLTNLDKESFHGSSLQVYYPINVTYNGFGTFQIAMTMDPLGFYTNETVNASHFSRHPYCFNSYYPTIIMLLKANYTGMGSIGVSFVNSSLYNSKAGQYTNTDQNLVLTEGSYYKIGPYVYLCPSFQGSHNIGIFNGTYYMSLTVALYRTVLGIPFHVGDITLKAPLLTIVNATSTTG